MLLEKFSEACVPSITGKKICCIERNAAYLMDLCTRCDILENIEMIVDENPKNYGAFELCGKTLEVQTLDSLTQLQLKDRIILITSDYYQEYYDKLRKLLTGIEEIACIYFWANQETEYELSYREACRNTPLEDIIVFRSGPHVNEYVKGMDFADNARALFEYALSIGLNNQYELVWLVKSTADFTAYSKYKNVSFIPFEGSISDDKIVRDKYYRVLCLAKYFFFTDAYGFARNCRADQIRIQLWHGCGYKKRLNSIPCNKRYEYMTVTSERYAKLHAAEFGLKKEQMLVTGCAKEDWLFDSGSNKLRELNIPFADKYLFWLPTYRFSEKKIEKPVDGPLYADTGLPLIADYEELQRVSEKLAENNFVLIIKIHPFQDKEVIRIGALSNIIVLDNDKMIEKDIQINQLLGEADALISDYSSTAVDYLLLDRPMAFLVDDMEEYGDARGFIFEDILNWLPGEHITSVEGLITFIEGLVKGVDSSANKRRKLLRKIHKNRDRNNCSRILEAVGIKQF